MLEVQQLYGGYNEQAVLKNLTFRVREGELFGILGPNGSGKTTLLKMISGVLRYSKGDILLKGKSLSTYTPKQLAKVMAVLSQHSSQAFSYTVKETVSLGRYAHQKGFFREWREEDEEIVNRVMEVTGVTKFQDQTINELSGGEIQRVFLAQALAQEPEILLLDEPTNHLDLSYQKDLLDTLKRWTREQGITVISIFHDLNLAGLYCDRLLLMENGEMHSYSTPNDVLKQEKIESVYHTQVMKHPHPKVPAPQLVLLPEKEQFNQNNEIITEKDVSVTNEYVVLRSNIPLRTMSSGVIGAGAGWHTTFVNRHVDKSYNRDDHRQEMDEYLRKEGFDPAETVGMMTAVRPEDVVYRFYQEDEFSLFVAVTAGVGNAVDVTKSTTSSFELRKPGTINTWVFINGEITEEAFIQAIMTATEAKVKALHELHVKDAQTGTIATGTSTDSILVAASQKGKYLEFAGSYTPLGRLIGKAVYECTEEAVRKSVKRRKML